MSVYDVIVVGGGVVGAACARAAANRGLAVAIFEPGPEAGAATPASAGMLAAQIESSEQALGLAVRARDLYQPLAPVLQDATGIDIHLWQAGIASLAFDDGAEHRLKETVAAQRQAGLRCDWLEPDEVADQWPGITSPACRGALFSPEDGALDPHALARACLADARRLGATLVTEAVTAIAVADGRASGVVTPRGTTAGDHVVVAAGAWSQAIGALPHPPAVEPVRGQMAATPWPAGLPPAILYNEHCYVLARGHEALLGSTLEHAGFESKVTNEGLAQIFRCAIRVLPTLVREPVLRTWAGLRPMSADGLPIVGPDPLIAHLWYATGHGRNGVLLAALTGEVIGDLIAKGATAVDITAWQPARPGALTA